MPHEWWRDVAAKNAQWSCKVYCFSGIVHKDDALRADEADQKNADAMKTDEDDDDAYLDGDAGWTSWTQFWHRVWGFLNEILSEI